MRSRRVTGKNKKSAQSRRAESRPTIKVIKDQIEFELSPETLDGVTEKLPFPTGESASGDTRMAAAAAPLNSLFSLLSRLESFKGRERVVIRQAAGKQPVGEFLMLDGRILDASFYAGGIPDIVATLQRERPDLKSALSHAKARAAQAGIHPADALIETGEITREQLKAASCERISEIVLAMVQCGLSGYSAFESVQPEAGPDGPVSLGLPDVLVAATRSLVGVERDAAAALYQELATNAKAALLLARPAKPTFLPVPVRMIGLGSASMGELREVCRSTAEMCGSAGAGQEGTTVRTYVLRHCVWICVAGEKHFLLTRVSNAELAASLGIAYQFTRRKT